MSSSEEFHFLMEQLQQLEQYVRMLMQHIQELSSLRGFLDEMKTVSPGSSILFPMGSGIFFRGTVTDTSHVVMNVGSGVALPQTLGEASSRVQLQLEQMEQTLSEMEEEFKKRSSRLQELQSVQEE